MRARCATRAQAIMRLLLADLFVSSWEARSTEAGDIRWGRQCTSPRFFATICATVVVGKDARPCTIDRNGVTIVPKRNLPAPRGWRREFVTSESCRPCSGGMGLPEEF